MRLAYVIPTRDRPQILAETLDALGALPRHAAQVIIVDNASASPPRPPRTLRNGFTVEMIRLPENSGAAARNAAVAASDTACEWIVMLDDDSAPLTLGHLPVLDSADVGVAAISAEIWLGAPAASARPSDPSTLGAHTTSAPRVRESGGLPEVFIGCGVAIRRSAFLDAGGYDPAFGYYAEEYDLAARFLLNGMRIEMDRRFQVLHRKVTAGRDMNLILSRLIRNNGWVMQRYAPARRRIGELSHTIARYSTIASRELARRGYDSGLRELLSTLHAQRRTPMPGPLWDRFTGKAAAAASLERAWIQRGFRTAALIDEGKNASVIRSAMKQLGIREVAPDQANTLIIGTLSPGPMLDALDRRRTDGRVICPWDMTTPAAASIAA